MRTTNNSVASLEEQSQVIDSLIPKESSTKKKQDSKISKKTVKKAVEQEVSDRDVQNTSDEGDYYGVPNLHWNVPPEYQAYGNFVPNYALGQGPLWAPQGTHEISEAESEEDVVSYADSELYEGSEISEDSKAQHVQPQEIPEIKATGNFANILKKQITQVKEADKLSKKLSPPVAVSFTKALSDCVYSSEMEKLSKSYPRIENVENMKVPKLDAEVFQSVDQRVRNMDQSLQGIQKAVLGAMSAVSPVIELLAERGDNDKELDDVGQNLIDTVQLLAFASNTLSNRRRELLKPCLSPLYARVLTRGHDTTPDWLFGGDLLGTTKKLDAAKRISDKVIKRKNTEQQKGRFQNPKRFRLQQPAYQQGQGQGMLRAYNPYQYQAQYRFPNPQQFQQQYMPMGFPGDYRQQRPRQFYQNQQGQGQQQQPSFPKKGNNQK